MKILTAVIIILSAASFSFGENSGKKFERLVRTARSAMDNESAETPEWTDADALPPVIQKYLRITGTAETTPVREFSVSMNGRMWSSPDAAPMKIRCKQTNFPVRSARYFHITAWKAGLPAAGLHVYENGTASMRIKLLGLFTVAEGQGSEMNRAETVTFFNDLCLLSPSSLRDPRIEWLEHGPNSALARFTVNSISITAELIFDDEGKLIDFRSNDRYMMLPDGSMKNLPFSTPVQEYRRYGAFLLPAFVKTVWQMEDGSDFCYGEFRITDIGY